MKKLILLLFIPLVFTCSSDSSDDSQEDQTFLEKHNGIVWETSPESNVSYIQRLMFTNNPKAILSYFEEGNSVNCTTIAIGTCSNCYIIYENSNNILSIGSDVEVISTFTVSSDGLTLSYDSYDDGICNKTNLTEVCN
jgi:hypothetical protein